MSWDKSSETYLILETSKIDNFIILKCLSCTHLHFQRVICNDESEEDDRRDRYQSLEGGGVEVLLQERERQRSEQSRAEALGSCDHRENQVLEAASRALASFVD